MTELHNEGLHKLYCLSGIIKIACDLADGYFLHLQIKMKMQAVCFPKPLVTTCTHQTTWSTNIEDSLPLWKLQILVLVRTVNKDGWAYM